MRANSTSWAETSPIRDAAPRGVCEAPPTAAIIPAPAAPAATVLRQGTFHTAKITTVWIKPVSPPPGLIVTIRGRECRTSKCKHFL